MTSIDWFDFPGWYSTGTTLASSGGGINQCHHELSTDWRQGLPACLPLCLWFHAFFRLLLLQWTGIDSADSRVRTFCVLPVKGGWGEGRRRSRTTIIPQPINTSNTISGWWWSALVVTRMPPRLEWGGLRGDFFGVKKRNAHRLQYLHVNAALNGSSSRKSDSFVR